MSNLNFQPLQKPKVTDYVLNNIKDALMRGVLKPGDRLPSAAEMAGDMGVGVSSIREALKMLEGLGAVESRQGNGTYICDELKEGAASAIAIQFMLMPQSAEYLVQFREMYETAYMLQAMANVTTVDLEKVEAHVLLLEHKLGNAAPDDVVTAEDELCFHNAVLKCTHNPYVIKIGEASLDLFFVAMQNRLQPLKLREAAADHRNIFEAFKAKDYAQLQEVLHKSFSGWSARFSSGAFDAEQE